MTIWVEYLTMCPPIVHHNLVRIGMITLVQIRRLEHYKWQLDNFQRELYKLVRLPFTVLLLIYIFFKKFLLYFNTQRQRRTFSLWFPEFFFITLRISNLVPRLCNINVFQMQSSPLIYAWFFYLFYWVGIKTLYCI